MVFRLTYFVAMLCYKQEYLNNMKIINQSKIITLLNNNYSLCNGCIMGCLQKVLIYFFLLHILTALLSFM
jgi:hypothetical protein